MATKKTESGIRLKDKYVNEVVPAMIKEFGYKNVNEVPKLDKIVLNMGLGAEKDNSKSFNIAVDELAAIAGQKPVVTAAKKSIANFKLREGQKIGAKVTLRGKRMYEFLDRLIAIALPKVRDFRGIDATTGCDGRGNYSYGIKEQLIFQKLSMIKSRKSEVLISTLLHQLKLTTKLGCSSNY